MVAGAHGRKLVKSGQLGNRNVRRTLGWVQTLKVGPCWVLPLKYSTASQNSTANPVEGVSKHGSNNVKLWVVN